MELAIKHSVQNHGDYERGNKRCFRRSVKSHVGIRGSILFGKSPDPCRDSFYLFNPLSKEVCLRRTLIGHCQSRAMSASLIGRLGSSAFRVPTTAVSISLTGSRFSSGIGTEALPLWDSRTRWNNLFARPCRHSHRGMTPAQSQQRRCREDNDDNDLPWVEKPHRKDPT